MCSLNEPESAEPEVPPPSTSRGRKFDGPIPYSDLTTGVLKETYPGENHVSVTPESKKALVDAGLTGMPATPPTPLC